MRVPARPPRAARLSCNAASFLIIQGEIKIEEYPTNEYTPSPAPSPMPSPTRERGPALTDAGFPDFDATRERLAEMVRAQEAELTPNL